MLDSTSPPADAPPRERGPAAVFLDRDGTVIEDRHHLSDPDGVRLLPGAAEAVAALNRAGRKVLLITNQSGIGRGIFSEADFRAVQARVEELLASAGAHLDGVYLCPHSPDRQPPCECRKPATELYRRAAAEHGVELAGAAYIGDRLRDVLPAGELGGTGILLGTDPRDDPRAEGPPGMLRVASLSEAVEALLRRPPTD
jgi:D-glycero-D-manno-heptose 1,7-bisphosphate phosphatase